MQFAQFQSDVADTKCQGQAQSKYPCPFEHCTKGYKNLSTLKTHVEDKHRGPVDMWEFVRQNTKDLHNNLKPNMIGIKSDGNPFMLQLDREQEKLINDHGELGRNVKQGFHCFFFYCFGNRRNFCFDMSRILAKICTI